MYMFTDKINWYVFFISFAVGMFLVYVFGEDIKNVYVYPTPENTNDILFQDKTNNCFKYDTVEVPCGMFTKSLPVAE
jgi:hypothetical protein